MAGKKISVLSAQSPNTVAALAALGMPVQIVNAEISSPVAEIVLALPSGYREFELGFNVLVDAADSIYFRLSTDGGVTYHEGSTDYYSHSTLRVSGNVTMVSSEYENGEPLLVGNWTIQTSRPAAVKATIYPGGDGMHASVWSSAGSFQGASANAGHPLIEWWYSSLEANATRVTHIKILGPNLGDDNIISGYYSLAGMVEP